MGSSHDTVLVLFQNLPNSTFQQHYKSGISSLPLEHSSIKQRKLNMILDCQKLEKVKPFNHKLMSLAESYSITEYKDFDTASS